MFALMILAAALVTLPVHSDDTRPVLEPSQAIVAADAAPKGRHGRFIMTVVATGKDRKATYLNSSEDYRSPDNLTFRLAPNVARVLTKRFGSPAEQFLKGKRITVEGIVARRMIVNMEYGRPKSFNRWAHEVYVRLPSQIIVIE
jgi:hypothetical protein